MVNILWCQRVDVVNQKTVTDLIALHTEITTKISSYHFVSSKLPLARLVELLVQPPVEPERLPADFASQY